MGEKTFGMHSLVSAEILNKVSTEQLLLSVIVTPWIPGDNPTLIGLDDVPSDHKISYGGIPPSAVTSSSKSVFEISHSIRRSIGDNVNLASRLCSHAKANQIVISKSAYELLSNKSGFLKKSPIQVKGKSDKIDNWVFEVD